MKILFFFTILYALVACNPKNSQEVAKITMTADNMTDFNVYLNNLDTYSTADKDKAERLLQEAKNQPDRAMELAQKSLMAYPTATAYYEFSKALAAHNGSMTQVFGALQMAERLNYQPLQELYYEAAKQMIHFDTLYKLQACQGS